VRDAANGSLERRDALKLGGAWLVAGSLPWWSGCSAESAPGATNAAEAPHGEPDLAWKSPLERTLETARASGKPVLALVERDGDPWASMGRLIADAIAVGDDLSIAALALCEPVFATREQLRKELGPTVRVEGPGLIEFDDAGGRWRPIWIEDGHPGRFDAESPERARAAQNTEALKFELAGEDRLRRRAASARKALPLEFQRRLVERMDAGDTLPADELIRGAALVLSHRRWRDHVEVLAVRHRSELLARPLPGSRWAQTQGCANSTVEFLPTDDDGVRFDLDALVTGAPRPSRDARNRPLAQPLPERAGFACGMARRSDISDRFLLSYTDEP
jgi:hypothetical protein